MVVFRVLRVRECLTEHLEAGNATDILGRRAPLAFQEPRQTCVFPGGEEINHLDPMLPIVAHVVNVPELRDAGAPKLCQARGAGLVDSVAAKTIIEGRP